MWSEGGGGGARGPLHPARTHLPAPLWPLLWSSLAEDFVQGPQRSAVRVEQGAAVSSGSHKEEEKQSCKWSGRKERMWPPEPGQPWNRSSSARESCVFLPQRWSFGALPWGCPVPGLASGCGRSWVSACGPQCSGLARSMTSVPGSACPVPEGAARGLGVASDSGGLGTSRPQLAQPGAVVAVGETDVCWRRSAPGQRGRLHSAPLRPAHASVLGFCEGSS